jgi:hypothetical protein
LSLAAGAVLLVAARDTAVTVELADEGTAYLSPPPEEVVR